MTHTNGTAQEMPTVAALLDAAYRMERETFKAPTEFKMHPDDFAALKMQLKPHMVTDTALNTPPEIFGMRIVLDYTAARLPTKVHNAE